MITATSTDAEIDEMSEQMWSVLWQLPKDAAKATFSDVARAYRQLLLCDVEPAKAVIVVSTIALSVSGQSYEEVPGPRVKVRP
jgi:hypothetical protein